MFNEGDRVRIIRNGVIGEIIHLYKNQNGIMRYTVESDDEGPIDDPEAWNDVRFPQFICNEDQLEKI